MTPDPAPVQTPEREAFINDANTYLCTACGHTMGVHRFFGVYMPRVSCQGYGCACKRVLLGDVKFQRPKP